MGVAVALPEARAGCAGSGKALAVILIIADFKRISYKISQKI